MALVIRFCIGNKTDCKHKSVSDLTGVFSAANPGGFGTPNPEVSDIVSATLLIEKRETDGSYTSLATTNIYPTLPNIDGSEFILEGTAFNQEADTVIPDGIYRATYTIVDNFDNVYTANKTFVVDCSIQCCFKKLADKAAFQTCPSDIKEKFNEMSTLMRGLEAAKQCGDVVVINNLIDYLTKLCSRCGCNCN